MNDEVPLTFDVLTALADLAEPLAPAIARIRVALAGAEPIEEGADVVVEARAAIGSEGADILREHGLEGLSFALATIATEANDRADAFEALIQAAWSGLPLWGSAPTASQLPPPAREIDR